MKYIFLLIPILFFLTPQHAAAQTITYSEVEKSDNRNADFEILGKFGDNFLIYKNLNRRQEITVYNNDMTIKENIRPDFVSDKISNIDFITYPDHFLMIWQYQKNNTLYCKGADVDGNGRIIGNVIDMDTTRVGVFSVAPAYDVTWSEDKKKILMYKVQAKNNSYALTAKIFDGNFKLLDSTKFILSYNDNREAFGDLQIDNEGTILFSKEKQNARPEYINAAEINFRKINSPNIITVDIPLDEKQLIADIRLKIDNLNAKYLLSSFSYRNNGSNINGLLAALISRDSFKLVKSAITIFDDTLLAKLSGKPEWRTAYDDLFIRNIILKKDGGFIISSEEYFRRNRLGGNYDDRFGSYNPYSPYTRSYYGSALDYNSYNRGYYGYYRPYGSTERDIIYNYNDIVNFSFTKDLKLQWNSVINKTTSDIESDNFLSFANLNSGGELHFLFLQKDNNKQIISDHALQPNGNIVRYATLKGRESGYYFMPRLSRQTGSRQVIVPCIVRNNIAFAKIDF